MNEICHLHVSSLAKPLNSATEIPAKRKKETFFVFVFCFNFFFQITRTNLNDHSKLKNAVLNPRNSLSVFDKRLKYQCSFPLPDVLQIEVAQNSTFWCQIFCPFFTLCSLRKLITLRNGFEMNRKSLGV